LVRPDTGETLFAIADLSTMWLRAAVPENDIPVVRVGQELEVKIEALPETTFKAKINAIGAASDSSTRRVMVRSELTNPDRLLRPEMFATFKIFTGEGQMLPAIAAGALIREAETAFVYVEVKPQEFERRPVKVGAQQDGLVAIPAGLAVGERVVTRGAIFIDNEWKQ
jgi:cobalt-zinc-cadmium efflux system membrane fusion protein